MIFAAVICTLLAGFIASFISPAPFAMSIPIAVMGGFILHAIYHPKSESTATSADPNANDIDSDVLVTETMKRLLDTNCAEK